MQNKRLFSLFNSLLLASTLYMVSPVFAADSTSQPLIGIAMDYEEDKYNPGQIKTYEVYKTYTDAVSKAGGIPVLLPPVDNEKLKQVFARLDGVILVGGADYPSSYYNQPKHETADEMHPIRADFDLRLAKMAIEDKSKPILGICAGCQILNIAGGGSLIQDIPSHVKERKTLHRRPADHPKNIPFKHTVKIDKDSRLGAIYGIEELPVPTSHHQCVDKVADNFTVVAHAEDGMVEAIESNDKNRFLFGVQWHPERDFQSNQNLWKTFIQKCSNNKISQSQP